MDDGLLIKELAEKLGVTQDSVINWELRGIMPAARNVRKIVERFPHLPGLLDGGKWFVSTLQGTRADTVPGCISSPCRAHTPSARKYSGDRAER